jgi:hypothetical protein
MVYSSVFADSFSDTTRKELIKGSSTHTASQESVSPSFGSEFADQTKSCHVEEYEKLTPLGSIQSHESSGEREYGTDTRVVSALMRASAHQAMGKPMALGLYGLAETTRAIFVKIPHG